MEYQGPRWSMPRVPTMPVRTRPTARSTPFAPLDRAIAPAGWPLWEALAPQGAIQAASAGYPPIPILARHPPAPAPSASHRLYIPTRAIPPATEAQISARFDLPGFSFFHPF